MNALSNIAIVVAVAAFVCSLVSLIRNLADTAPVIRDTDHDVPWLYEIPPFDRDHRINLQHFLSTPTGKALIQRLRASNSNMGLKAGENKQFAAQRASEVIGYSECLTQIISLSDVPPTQAPPTASAEDAAGELLNKLSP